MNKITDMNNLVRNLNTLRKSGKSIVFTNGCFDILHAGHVRYLTEAKSKGDILVLGLNSDKSVRLIKGEKRPVVCHDQRAEVLAGLWCIDFITVFDEPDPLELIQTIKPDILIKGADWSEENIIGSDFVKANGGKVERISVVPDISTSRIIQDIIQLHK